MPKEAKKQEEANVPALFERMNLPAVTEHIKETLQTNLRGEALGIDDLEMVKLPSQGLTAFTVKDENGEDDLVKTITGILLHQHKIRAYWATSFAGGSQPPECHSNDCIRGNAPDEFFVRTNNPEKTCATCPFDQFGSIDDPNNPDSRAKACGEKRLMFILTPDSALPIILRASSMSLKSTKKYLVLLSFKKARQIYEVVTEFYLTKESNRSGQDVSVVHCRLADTLPADQIEQVKAYREQMMPLMAQAADRLSQSDDRGNGAPNVVAPPIDEATAAEYGQ